MQGELAGGLLFLEIISFLLACLIGVKKQTWLLSGYNEWRVKDKEKLAKLAGAYNAIVGVAAIIGLPINHPDAQFIFPLMITGYVILPCYVNTRMAE
ncbi:MAG: DUF3784 domain-containing protein [Ectobacillus sp.]